MSLQSESNFDMKRSERKSFPFLRVLGTIVSLGLVVYLMVREWSSVVAAMAEIPWYVFVAVMLLTLVSRLSVATRWYTLLRSGGSNIRFADALRLVFAGLFASNFLPTTVGGDVIRFGGALRFKVDPALGAASLVMDRLVGMAGMATVLPIGLVRFFSMPLPALPENGLPDLKLDVISVPAAFAWLGGRLRSFWDSGWRAIRLWLTHPMGLLWAYLCTWGHMLALFITVWWLLAVMGQPISFWMVAGLWSMSYFFTLLPISVNGLGLQELSLAFLFTNYGGASLHSVVVMAVVVRVLQILASLPGAVFVPGLLQPAEKTVKEDRA
jgi:uncharacterized membrane protein YbhN (UPF0104 family)